MCQNPASVTAVIYIIGFNPSILILSLIRSDLLNRTIKIKFLVKNPGGVSAKGTDVGHTMGIVIRVKAITLFFELKLVLVLFFKKYHLYVRSATPLTIIPLVWDEYQLLFYHAELKNNLNVNNKSMLLTTTFRHGPMKTHKISLVT